MDKGHVTILSFHVWPRGERVRAREGDISMPHTHHNHTHTNVKFRKQAEANGGDGRIDKHTQLAPSTWIVHGNVNNSDIVWV